MKVKDLIEELQRVDPELECFGFDPSGISYEVLTIGPDNTKDYHLIEAGVLCDYPKDFEFFCFSLDY